jgi:hypothetical protein
MKYFQIRALLTRYVVPLDVMNGPMEGKPMISFRKSLQSQPPVTLLKLVQIVRPLQSLLPTAAGPAKTILTTKKAAKAKKTKASRPKPSDVNARKGARPQKKK